MSVFDNPQQHELYDAVIWWQSIEIFHTLTCKDRSHRPLQPTIEQNGAVGLFCQDCEYAQGISPALAGMLLASYGDREQIDAITPFYAAQEAEGDSE